MASKARDAHEAEAVEVLADRGYFKSEEIAACEDASIKTYIPKPLTSNARAEGRFDRRDFVYERDTNSYVCPAGEELTYRMTTTKGSRIMHCCWTSVCGTCALKQHCTTSQQRRVERWEHEDVLDRAEERLDRRPDAMIVRRSTVEHPFGQHQGVDGRYTLQDEDAEARRHRDGTARAGLQSEAGNGDLRGARVAERDVRGARLAAS